MPKNILLIEDDIPTVEIYEIAFKHAGFNIETIKIGEEALKRVNEIKEGKAQKPDLVLLDLILPDMNGIEILREIRRYPETKDIMVYILTNYADQELEKTGYDLKTEKYLIKTDYTPRELIDIVKERLGR